MNKLFLSLFFSLPLCQVVNLTSTPLTKEEWCKKFWEQTPEEQEEVAIHITTRCAFLDIINKNKETYQQLINTIVANKKILEGMKESEKVPFDVLAKCEFTDSIAYPENKNTKKLIMDFEKAVGLRKHKHDANVFVTTITERSNELSQIEQNSREYLQNVSYFWLKKGQSIS